MQFKFLTNLFFSPQRDFALICCLQHQTFWIYKLCIFTLPWGYEDHITICLKKYVHFPPDFEFLEIEILILLMLWTFKRKFYSHCRYLYIIFFFQKRIKYILLLSIITRVIIFKYINLSLLMHNAPFPFKSQVENTVKLKILNCTSSSLEENLSEWMNEWMTWRCCFFGKW